MEERHKLSIDVQTRILPLIDNLVVPQNPAIVPNVPGVPNPSIIPTIPSTPPIIPGVQIPSVPGGMQSMESIFQIIAQKIGEVVQSPGFQQGLSSQQSNLINQYTEMSKKFTNPLSERLKDILGDISIDMESGKLTKSQIDKYLKNSKG